jgi:hypothetical protein
MSDYFVKNVHQDLNNFDMYLQDHFDRVSYDDDADANACITDMKYVSKRLKKLDRIEKILEIKES